VAARVAAILGPGWVELGREVLGSRGDVHWFVNVQGESCSF